ncbi:MAG: hypothetical protein II938_00970 [Alphaproteobacteria bacterium]|nr:hypothetical protein [Alphaproteobacteria bacterium]
MSDRIYPQHFYPLSIKDYCYAIKSAVKKGLKALPILSISSKDYPYCDFSCEDCLACPSRNWAIKAGHIKYPVIPLDKYKNMLKEISRYSKERGVDRVRFEFCGEGNPDLYEHRAEIIRYAAQECNMGVVYVSTGSHLTDDLCYTLVKNASFIRISFPGITTEAYAHYSGQSRFGYNDALNLLKKLVALRQQMKRENGLLLGVRTCLRKDNDGHYKDFIKTIGELGVDCFQGVKVLLYHNKESQYEKISPQTIRELNEIKEEYAQYGLKHFVVPNDLSSIHINRALRDTNKPLKCWSSKISPALYGSNLICCVLWDRIINSEFHYGIMEGESGELESMMHGERAEFIAQHCPSCCEECCSFADNQFIDELWKVLKLQDDIDEIDFFFEYC